MLLLCSRSSISALHCGPSSTGLTIFFLSLLSTDGFIDKEHWSLACYIVLTITSICAQYIKYSDNNYLGVSLVRSFFISIPLDHVPTYLGPSLKSPSILFVYNYKKKRYEYPNSIHQGRSCGPDRLCHRLFVHSHMIVRVAHYTATKCANDYGIMTTMLSRFYVNRLGTYQLDHLRMW